jgi:hypothetical protein
VIEWRGFARAALAICDGKHDGREARMRADLDDMEVELDLSTNRYSGRQTGQKDVDFARQSKTFHDYSAASFSADTVSSLIPRFSYASFRASCYRWRSIRAITQRAAKCAISMQEANETSRHDLECMVGAYNRLKTLRPVQLSCLPDALACLFFLSNLGCAANFVIGVRANPFRAHAWLEINGAVANDVVANVFNFTPILETRHPDHLREIFG